MKRRPYTDKRTSREVYEYMLMTGYRYVTDYQGHERGGIRVKHYIVHHMKLNQMVRDGYVVYDQVLCVHEILDNVSALTCAYESAVAEAQNRDGRIGWYEPHLTWEARARQYLQRIEEMRWGDKRLFWSKR